METALLFLKEACEKEGTQFVLVSNSGCWTFLARENLWFSEKAEYLELRYKWIEEFAERHHITYLDLNRAFLQEYCAGGLTSGDIHIPWDGHWTPLGHRLAAENMHLLLRRRASMP
jgi:hypothetical protein